MPSLSLPKLYFVFSVIAITNVVVVADVRNPPEFLDSLCRNPYKLVNKVCRKQINRPFCLEVLKSDTRSKFAKNITTLTTIAVDVAAKNSTATRDYFLGVKTGPPALLKSLMDCVDPYNNVINSFKNCLQEEDCSLVGYDIHGASDEVRRCQLMTDSNGAHDSFITTRNNVTLDFWSLGESLANLMCTQIGV